MFLSIIGSIRLLNLISISHLRRDDTGKVLGWVHKKVHLHYIRILLFLRVWEQEFKHRTFKISKNTRFFIWVFLKNIVVKSFLNLITNVYLQQLNINSFFLKNIFPLPHCRAGSKMFLKSKPGVLFLASRSLYYVL